MDRTGLEERERQDREKAEDIRKRQIRLGDVPDPNKAEEEESEPDENN